MHALCLAVCAFFFLAAGAHGERRLALVIGINDYEEVPRLEKAVGDAHALAGTLEKLGFKVTEVNDPGRRDLNQAIAAFGAQISRGDTALVHFSGHAIEINGENYLLPADTPRPDNGAEDLVKAEAIRMSDLVARIADTGAGVRIFVIDACRNNPFEQVGVRSVGSTRGLSRIEAPGGTFIMYSAGYRQTALDRLDENDPEPTSVYTRVLLKHISEPGKAIDDIAQDVRQEVEAIASGVGHDQRPAYYDELSARFFMVPGVDAADGVSPSPADPVTSDYLLAERIGTVSAWDAFLAKHGSDDTNFYVQLATAARRNILPLAPAGRKAEPGDGEGEVSIVAWAGYIERGETDPNYDWVTKFEADTGCKVSVKTAATSDEMVALMNEGGFDLVTASGDASLRLIAGKRVQAISTDRILSWSNVDPRLQNAPWHTVDGVHYGVPFQWGPNVLMYDTEAFKGQAPTSWSVVFEEQTLPDGRSNKGRVQAFDGAIYIADAALYLMHHRPDLRIKDPYELTEVQYKAALDLLRAQRQIVSRYWHDAFVQIDDFTNEGVVASSSWPFQVNILKSQSKPIASTVPEEGATGWADTTMMHSEAAHPNCAYMWLEHSINPKLQGDLAAWFGSVPANLEACTGNPLLTDEGCVANGEGNFDRIHFWKTPTDKCATQESCVAYSRWASDYIAVLGGR